MHTILFDSVVPAPLREMPHSGEVWNAQLKLIAGTNYVISAESGKGKSTFLNLIFGSRRDYTGNLIYNELNTSGFSAEKWAQVRSTEVSYLFQDLKLFPDLTAFENIALKPGCVKSSYEIEDAAEKLGIKKLLDRPCRKLSLGQQQRVALVRAISTKFKWLLLDEPFSHLDSQNAKILLELCLERSAEEGASIIATSLGNDELFLEFGFKKIVL